MKMGRKLTLAVMALTLVAVLAPAPQANAINSEVFYTVMLECQCWCPAGEWTRPCEGGMYGWGQAPYTGDPSYCYKTYVTYGDPCD
jgi:hypothetical protein